jgi:hypothetical protein
MFRVGRERGRETANAQFSSRKKDAEKVDRNSGNFDKLVEKH